MPEKRREHKNVQRFCCPYCGRRLWSLGRQKHFFHYSGSAQIQQDVNILHKAIFIDNKSAYIDHNSCTKEFLLLEEFLCGDHGKLWMKVTRKTCDTVVATTTSKKKLVTDDSLNPIKHAQLVSKQIRLLHKLSDKNILQQRTKRSNIFIAKNYTYFRKIYQFLQKK